MGSPLQLAAAVFVLAAAAAAGATLGVYAVERLMEFLWPMRYGRRRRYVRPTPKPDPSATLLMYTGGRAGVPRGPR